MKKRTHKGCQAVYDNAKWQQLPRDLSCTTVRMNFSNIFSEMLSHLSAHGWDVEQSDLALSGTSKFVNDFWPRVHLRYDAIVCSWGSCISKCLVCSIMHAIGLSFWGRIRKLNLIAEDYLNRVGRKEKGSERNKGSWTLDSQSQSANQRPAGKPSEVSCWSYKSMKLA